MKQHTPMLPLQILIMFNELIVEINTLDNRVICNGSFLKCITCNVDSWICSKTALKRCVCCEYSPNYECIDGEKAARRTFELAD